MKRFIKGFLIALAIGALASISAYAGDKNDKNKVEKKTVTIPSDVMVNGTLVKAGDYEVAFNESTGELSIIKNGKIKAKTAAHVEARTDKAKTTSLRTREQGGNAELVAVTFGGSNQNFVVGSAGATSGAQ